VSPFINSEEAFIIIFLPVVALMSSKSKYEVLKLIVFQSHSPDLSDPEYHYLFVPVDFWN